ncbi:MAG: OmpH family outer membrane protein [Syntrophales bacterium]|nr:OmpH family outer membrane protein [Syntrophales bacterium]
MKKYLRVVGLTVVIFIILSLPAFAVPEKIGIVNVEEVLVASEAGKAANEDLKKIYEKNKAAIEQKEKELQKMKDELEKQRPILKEKVLREKEQAYQKEFRAYQDMVKDANDEMQSRRQELFNKYYPEIIKIIQSLGEKEQFTLIMDISTIPIVYFDKERNITRKVLEEFNKTYKEKK